jgi:hypothetical protein
MAMQAWLNQQLGQNIAKSKVTHAPPIPSIEQQMEQIRSMTTQAQAKFKEVQRSGGGIDVTI